MVLNTQSGSQAVQNSENALDKIVLGILFLENSDGDRLASPRSVPGWYTSALTDGAGDWMLWAEDRIPAFAGSYSIVKVPLGYAIPSLSPFHP